MSKPITDEEDTVLIAVVDKPWYRCPHTATCPRYNGCAAVHHGPNPPESVKQWCGVREEELTWERM
jgi:hypothetical protein